MKYRLVFHDGDNAPLSPIDLSVWSNRHLLIFPWPGGEDISLFSGSPKLTRPVYDLASLRKELLERHFSLLEVKAASLNEAAQKTTGGNLYSRKTAKLVFVILLCIACAVLIIIVARTVKEIPPPKEE